MNKLYVGIENRNDLIQAERVDVERFTHLIHGDYLTLSYDDGDTKFKLELDPKTVKTLRDVLNNI